MGSRTRSLKPGYVVTYPNRHKRSSRLTRVAVALLVLALSALLMLFVTIGGWSKLAGLEPST